MQQLIENLMDLDGVKAVKKQSGPVLRIDLFTRPVRDSDAVEIHGDLRKISQQIRVTLDAARKNGVVSSWNWIVRPQKKYQSTSLGRNKVSDRKPKGHEPGYYRVSVEE